MINYDAIIETKDGPMEIIHKTREDLSPLHNQRIDTMRDYSRTETICRECMYHISGPVATGSVIWTTCNWCKAGQDRPIDIPLLKRVYYAIFFPHKLMIESSYDKL